MIEINQIDLNGKKTGYWDYWHYSDIDLYYKGYFINDIAIGYIEWYYPNDNTILKEFFI